MKKIIISLVVATSTLFAAAPTTNIKIRYITLAATKNLGYAENFAKDVDNKLKNNKYFDFVDVSTKGKNNFIYIKTKDINNKEAKTFLDEVKEALNLTDSYYCRKESCGFDVKKVNPKDVEINKNPKVKITLDEIVEKLSKE